MGSIYSKRGVWYAPPWRNPRSGKLAPGHSLATGDPVEAEIRWTLEKARALQVAEAPVKQLSILETATAATLFSEVVDLYLARKKHGIAAATYTSYLTARVQVLKYLGDRPVGDFAPPTGTHILLAWVNAEIHRLKGRTHTVKKRLEGLIKPVLRMARKQGLIADTPDFPDVASDYESHGRRDFSLSVDEFVALRAALPEIATHTPLRGRPFDVYPRLWADLAVATGLHESDLHTFRGEYWRRLSAQWYRVNSKGARHYPACWLPCEAHLQSSLGSAHEARGWRPGGLLIADAPPPPSFMRRHLFEAAKAAGLPHAPSAIDFRHTFAVWRRDAGWGFDVTARWLGNSSGMVRKVYGQIPDRNLRALAEEGRPASELLLQKIAGLHPPEPAKPPEKLAAIVQLNPPVRHPKPTKKRG